MEITVIGAGLAGVEAAHQITRMGGRAVLFEMRPGVGTPAHRTSLLAELVCSNSLKSLDLHNAHGLLKEELRGMGSVIMEAADRTAIPGGKALVVDRDRFAARVTEMTGNNPGIRLVREEARRIPEEGIVIIATGPLTSDALSGELQKLTGEDSLSFFDAISPIVDAASIDHHKAFHASRYMKGEAGDYLNCPLTREEYDLFHEALVKARGWISGIQEHPVSRFAVESWRSGENAPSDPETRGPYGPARWEKPLRRGAAPKERLRNHVTSWASGKR